MSDLEATFPKLAELGVTHLYRTEECEYIVYERGAFVTEPGTESCEIDVEGPGPRDAIDPRARADLDAIYAVREQFGSSIQQAFQEYDAGGRVVGGQFGFEWCTQYIYDPSWSQLPAEEDSGSVATAVNGDWYELKCPTSLY